MQNVKLFFFQATGQVSTVYTRTQTGTRTQRVRVLKQALIRVLLGQVRMVCGPQLVGKVACVRATATSYDGGTDQSRFQALMFTYLVVN